MAYSQSMTARLLLLATVVSVALCAAPARAQLGVSRLTGTVRDAQGGVLPGVTVTANLAALIGVRPP